MEENLDVSFVTLIHHVRAESNNTLKSMSKVCLRKKRIKLLHEISSLTSCFLSGDNTACCRSVIAVSGGPMLLVHRALHVTSLT